MAESIIARLPKDGIYEQVSVPLLEKYFDDFVVPEMLNKYICKDLSNDSIDKVNDETSDHQLTLPPLSRSKSASIKRKLLCLNKRKNDFEIIHIFVNRFF